MTRESDVEENSTSTTPEGTPEQRDLVSGFRPSMTLEPTRVFHLSVPSRILRPSRIRPDMYFQSNTPTSRHRFDTNALYRCRLPFKVRQVCVPEESRAFFQGIFIFHLWSPLKEDRNRFSPVCHWCPYQRLNGPYRVDLPSSLPKHSFWTRVLLPHVRTLDISVHTRFRPVFPSTHVFCLDSVPFTGFFFPVRLQFRYWSWTSHLRPSPP